VTADAEGEPFRGPKEVPDMKVLVAYASRHGATRGIAERIASTLERRGLTTTLQAVEDQPAVAEYDAFVVGSAAYMGQWLNEATRFVRANSAILSTHPTWLFSSGPIGTETVDAKGNDVVKAAEPRQFIELGASLRPKDERVFFGAFDPDAEPIGAVERLGSLFTRMPAVRKAMPAGDFRDWPAIEAWADGIATELGQPAVAPVGAGGTTR
jgi:menaquinone-dependent protoporphyrinogen oxidase